MLNFIEIQNIKGIQHKRFELEIFPNKPSLLVAPNGYGKSSVAIGFNSMNNRRIKLEDENCYKENPANLPSITIQYVRADGNILNLHASHNTNTISSELDYFVINNQTKPKGIGSLYGTATATLEIKQVVLVDRIPPNIGFGYSFRDNQARFGNNGKVIPNLSIIIGNLKLVEKLSSEYLSLYRANGQRVQQKIEESIQAINNQRGASNVLLKWIEDNQLEQLRSIDYINTIAEIIGGFDIGLDYESQTYLAAIQLVWLYNDSPNTFKSACEYNNYRLDKQQFDQTLATFNSTWKNIRSSETGGQLLVKFPKANNISNGQRDILTFISMLFRAKRHLKKQANILIIDEVFDYLDDANLTAAQYYITILIDEYVSAGKRIYPLILTHLNPNYFKNFAFNNQKVYYLNKSNIQVNQHFIRLLRNRKNPTIEDDVSKYLLHFHPNNINKRPEFRALGIPELWGEGQNFNAYLNDEINNYLNDRPFDPFAVCGAVRVRIEEIAYNKLRRDNTRNEFLETNMTRKKLEKAEEMGVVSPESHYLLGIIYNEGMHWKDGQDNISPIASKLENLTIKKLIRDIF